MLKNPSGTKLTAAIIHSIGLNSIGFAENFVGLIDDLSLRLDGISAIGRECIPWVMHDGTIVVRFTQRIKFVSTVFCKSLFICCENNE